MSDHSFIKMNDLAWCKNCGMVKESVFHDGEYVTIYRRPGELPTEVGSPGCVPVSKKKLDADPLRKIADEIDHRRKVQHMSRDVTVEDLAFLKGTILDHVYNQIVEQWVGDHLHRMTSVRCGTLYVYNENDEGRPAEEGTGAIRLALRFPLIRRTRT